MKIGIHAYAYCSQWSNDSLDLIDRIKDLGLDFIEIPLMVLEDFDAVSVSQRLSKVGLDVVTSTVLDENTDITSDKPEIRTKGVEYLKDCVKATHDVGGLVCRVLFILNIPKLHEIDQQNRHGNFLLNV